MANCLRRGSIIGAIPAVLALQACSFGGSSEDVVSQDMPFERAGRGAYTSIDRRAWQINDASDFSGLVVADEPQAADVARDILEAGGNAADAATALYFALSVTYSGAAGLGGGGSCLYYEEGRSQAKQIDFPALVPATGGTVPVPGNVRGFTYLNAKYGSMPWRKVVGPAAKLAGGGAVMSRATQVQIRAAAGQKKVPDGLMVAGRPVNLGRPYSQPSLAATLGVIQGGGAGPFHKGDLGDTFVKETTEMGGTLTRADLRNYQISVSDARRQTIHSTSIFTRNGSAQDDAAWSGIASASGTPSQASGLDDAGTTNFVVADSKGRAITCTVTMGSLYGTGQYSPTSSIYFADVAARPTLGAGVIISHAERGLVYVANSRGQSGLQKSVALANDVAIAKTIGLGGALRRYQGSDFDAVNVIHCKEGLVERAKSCRFGTEPNANGYGLMAR